MNPLGLLGQVSYWLDELPQLPFLVLVVEALGGCRQSLLTSRIAQWFEDKHRTEVLANADLASRAGA